MALAHTAPTPRIPVSGRATAVPELGMRRVRWVVLSVTDDSVRAEVAGLAHRFPLLRPVTLQVANRLIRAGCPYVVRDDVRRSAARPAQAAEPGAS